MRSLEQQIKHDLRAANTDRPVEDFIDGMVNAFFENLDELVRLTPDEKADVEMCIRHHIVRTLQKRLTERMSSDVSGDAAVMNERFLENHDPEE